MLPVGLDVVGSTEKLDLPGAGRESLYHAVDLIWFVTGGADLEERVRNVMKGWNLYHITATFPGCRNHKYRRYNNLPRPQLHHSPNLC